MHLQIEGSTQKVTALSWELLASRRKAITLLSGIHICLIKYCKRSANTIAVYLSKLDYPMLTTFKPRCLHVSRVCFAKRNRKRKYTQEHFLSRSGAKFFEPRSADSRLQPRSLASASPASPALLRVLICIGFAGFNLGSVSIYLGSLSCTSRSS